MLSERIKEHAVAWAVAEIDSARIDAWNIYQASRQAMTAALEQLSTQPDYLLIDAMKLDVLIEQKSLIKGDARCVSIAAASILAKTYRDARMQELDAVYPQYGLAQHKGYATPEHLEALRKHGASPLHRYSFAPVREVRLLGQRRGPDRSAARPVPVPEELSLTRTEGWSWNHLKRERMKDFNFTGLRRR